MNAKKRVPVIVGIGGSTRQGSSSERALRVALDAARSAGATIVMLTAEDIEFPMYRPELSDRTPAAKRFVEEIERADGVIIASPGYHGSVSGLIKNALDYLEDLREAEPPYLDGRAVGCIVCASGWQATMSALGSLRTIVHALRGWPTPLGVGINSAESVEAHDESGFDRRAVEQLRLLGNQVVAFSHAQGSLSPRPEPVRAPDPDLVAHSVYGAYRT